MDVGFSNEMTVICFVLLIKIGSNDLLFLRSIHKIVDEYKNT